MKLFIGNKAYSSWSLRGWLACKLSGLPFEEVVGEILEKVWKWSKCFASHFFFGTYHSSRTLYWLANI